jgi:zinc transport system substrate-binding protein
MSNRLHPWITPLAIFTLSIGSLSACGSDSTGVASPVTVDVNSTSQTINTPSVYVAFYPIEEAAKVIAGDAISVVSLTPVGVSPHEIDLAPEVLSGLESAEAVLYLGRGFQPAIEKALRSLPRSVTQIDLLADAKLLKVDNAVDGVEGDVDGEVLDGGVDPHVWVDPVRFAEMIKIIEATLIEIAPIEAQAISARAKTYRATITALDTQFKAGLAACESTAIVTSHRAFGYLANRYGLQQLPIAGISPEEEPSPKSLEAVAKAAKAQGVKVVFFESLVPKALSDTVAQEIGATTSSLDPIEGFTQKDIDAGSTYVSVQQQNLQSLRAGLRCK